MVLNYLIAFFKNQLYLPEGSGLQVVTREDWQPQRETVVFVLILMPLAKNFFSFPLTSLSVLNNF